MTQLAETLFPELQLTCLTRVYFGLGICRERVKIGLTGRPSGHRGGEMGFDELCSVPGGGLTERMYQGRYAAERFGKTEWFRLSDRLLMDLYAMCVKQERDNSAADLRCLIEQRLNRRIAA